MNKCFADLGSCKILKIKKCQGCKFYKTEEQLENERKKSFKRLKSLDKLTRINIAEKYKIGGIV
jgi:hypothetical protein